MNSTPLSWHLSKIESLADMSDEEDYDLNPNASTDQMLQELHHLSAVSTATDRASNLTAQMFATPGEHHRYDYIVPQLLPLADAIAQKITTYKHQFLQHIDPIPKSLLTAPSHATTTTTTSQSTPNAADNSSLTSNTDPIWYTLLEKMHPKLYALIKNYTTKKQPLKATAEVLVTKSAVIQWSTFHEIAPCRWLSMEWVNAWFDLLSAYGRQKRAEREKILQQHKQQQQQQQQQQQHQSDQPQTPLDPLPTPPPYVNKCYMLSAQFFATFGTEHNFNYDYSRVARWSTRGADKAILNDCDYVLVPCNINKSHWTLLVADVKNRLICYLDSFGQRSDGGRAEMLRRYLHDEFLKHGGWNGYDDNDNSNIDNNNNINEHDNNNITDNNNKRPTVNHDLLKELNTTFDEKDNALNNTNPTTSDITTLTALYPSNDPTLQKKHNNNRPLSPASALAAEQTPRYAPFTIVYPFNIPVQHNGYDCGVFISVFAYCLALNLPIKTNPVLDTLAIFNRDGSDQSNNKSNNYDNYNNNNQQPQQFTQQSDEYYQNMLSHDSIDRTMTTHGPHVVEQSQDVVNTMTLNQLKMNKLLNLFAFPVSNGVSSPVTEEELILFRRFMLLSAIEGKILER